MLDKEKFLKYAQESIEEGVISLGLVNLIKNIKRGDFDIKTKSSEAFESIIDKLNIKIDTQNEYLRKEIFDLRIKTRDSLLSVCQGLSDISLQDCVCGYHVPQNAIDDNTYVQEFD